VKFSFFHLFRFRVDNARVIERVSMNPSMTVGPAACRLLCRYRLLNVRNTLAASCICWIVALSRVNQAKEIVTVRVWNASDHRRTRWGVGGGDRPPGLKNFRASASCSKILN